MSVLHKLDSPPPPFRQPLLKDEAEQFQRDCAFSSAGLETGEHDHCGEEGRHWWGACGPGRECLEVKCYYYWRKGHQSVVGEPPLVIQTESMPAKEVAGAGKKGPWPVAAGSGDRSTSKSQLDCLGNAPPLLKVPRWNVPGKTFAG